MKRIALGLTLLFFLVGVVFADFGKTLNNFRLQFETYTRIHKEYQTAKTAYLQFRTLPAETEAFSKMKQVLSERAKILESYFAVIFEKTNQISPNSESGESVMGEIVAERTFLTEFSKRAENAKNITEAENLSSEFETKRQIFQNLQTKGKGIVFALKLFEISKKSNNLTARIETTWAQNQVSDLALREEKINLARVNIAEAAKLTSSGRNSFNQINLTSTKVELSKNENAGKTDLNKAKTLLEQAVLAIKEAARGF